MGVYEQVEERGVHVGSDVHVGFEQVWNAAQLASKQVNEPGQVEEPWHDGPPGKVG